MTRLITLIIALSWVITGCDSNGRNDFSLTVRHYAGGAGLTVIYTLSQNSLEVRTDCDLENCKEQTVYMRTFGKDEGDSIYQFIRSIKLDTLKSYYETKGVMDGLVTELTFRRGLFSSHSVKFDNFDTPATDTLFRFIDKLVLTKKYKFFSRGDDE